MPDFGLSVLLSRTNLGLADLQLNDHDTYYVASESFANRQVQWTRAQATSPFLEGSVTTYRTRQNVMTPLHVEINGDSSAAVQAAATVLKTAMCQSRYTLSLSYSGGAAYRFDCEAADFTEVFTGPRWVARQLQIQFAIPNQPVPLVGGGF